MTGKTDDTNMDHSDLRARVVALEQWRVQKDIDSARHDERWKSMDDKIVSVGKKVDEVAGTLKFLSRTFMGAIIFAIAAFLVAGGFHVP